MSNPNSEIGIYTDLLIAETLLGDPRLLKTAQAANIASTIIEKVKNYFGSKVNPNDKVGSVLNMLAPGAIRVTFGAMGMPWMGLLLGLATSFFHIDVGSILEGIWNKLKEALEGGKQISSQEVHNIVQSSVDDHVKPATEEEADTAAQHPAAQQMGANQADDGLTLSTKLRHAQIMRTAMEEYFVNKEAASRSWLNAYRRRKSTTGSILSSVLSLVFRVALSSAGLLLAGDVMNKFLNRPNSLDGSIQQGKPVGGETASTPTTSLPVSSRPVKPGYVDEVKNSPSTSWIENVTNNQSSIQQMLLNFAEEVYPIQGQESAIESNPTFQRLVRMVSWYNNESPGGPIVYIPRMFTTKKQLVDSFIDSALPQNAQANR